MKKLSLLLLSLLVATTTFAQKIPNYSPDIKMEKLGRGLVAYRKVGTSYHYITWRYLKTDPVNIGFNIYSANYDGTTVGTPVLVNTAGPIKNNTFYARFYASSYTGAIYYYLKEVHDGVEKDLVVEQYLLKTQTEAPDNYIEIPMKAVKGVKRPSNYSVTTLRSCWVYDDTGTDSSFEYHPNDASFADLDGDGEMEIVVHCVGPRAQDNANSGTTDSPVLQAYKLDGTFMWEINLGINIREGAHYTQFLVYDFDGCGKAEVVCKTAEGSRDALGNYCGEAYFPTYKQRFSLPASRNYNRDANYRNSNGYILTGPEFLTIFNGETGAEITTIEYDPPRYSTIYNNGNEVPVLDPTTAEINTMWGDNYGNRVDRFLACVAYLDGIRPSAVMCRGYYSRTVLVAYDFDGKELKKRWKFDTDSRAGQGNSSYRGQGNHNLRVGDVDGDGKDEIVYGSCTIDHDGKGLYNTGFGHGDAMHLTDFIPERPGLEVLQVHESGERGTTLRDAHTGAVVLEVRSTDDVGRGMGTDISSAYRGMEWWSSRTGGVCNAVNGNVISSGGVSMNMACWWDGDLLRELQDDKSITKYNNGTATTLLDPSGVSSNNGTKANPCIVADIIGDWREEMVVRTTNNRAIRIYMTDKSTNYRFHSFLQDPVYRLSVAYQNVAYNQPTHTGFYFGSDLERIFVARDIKVEGDSYKINAIFDQAISYDWSTGDSTQIITVEREYETDTLPKKIVLAMNYQGWIFKDSLTLTFAPKATAVENITETGKIALFTNPVKTEMSICFDETGIYDCFFYDLAGRVTMKTTLVVGGKSVQTIDVSELPPGMGILVIENNKTQFREKFLKL